ncbi:MAG: threonine aldolase [Peptococcaceae bacterium]|jgi:threonine aldolase|nr:threonine aldolase [Peptococcaceae bacterium]
MSEFFLDFTLSSDTWSPAHPRMAEAIGRACEGYAPPYGEDGLTKAAVAEFKKILGSEIEVFFALNGTGANVLALSALMDRCSGIICPDSAHINNHETGAPERLLGAKLLPCPHRQGKLAPEDIRRWAARRGDPGYASPDVVSIAQTTEYGTVYTAAEVAAICRAAHENGMLVHMDGARFANAVAALGSEPLASSGGAGVDALCFGGTKNGFVFGEAIVFFNRGAARRFAWLQKQHLQLASKNRYIAAQFEAALRGGLWLELARQANQTAARLAAALEAMPGAALVYPVQSNQIFLRVPSAWHEPLRRWTSYGQEADGTLRLVTSWNTTEAQIDDFIAKLKTLLPRPDASS